MFRLVEDRSNKGKELRMIVVETLQELMQCDDKVVALEADLGGASGFTKIQKSNPDRFVQCGIAEANMVGVSAGLSLTGMKPFMHTFGPFATRRVYDQIFLSGAYAKTTMNIYGSDPGFCVGANGGTHTTWEDVALMRAIPNAIVCDAADEQQLAWIIKEFAKLEGVHYVRANRKDVRNVYAKGSTFELGKGNVLCDGKDILIISAGQLVFDVLDSAQALEASGYSTQVIDMFTIKPLDVALLKQAIGGKKLIVSVENHSITGGLGSAVAEVLSEMGCHIPLKRIGVNERFGQVGTPDFLQKEFGLSAEAITNTIKKIIEVK